jgi:transcriptional regulator with XRE-family HTH domain
MAIRKYEARFKLQEFRIYRKLSQKELADRIGVTQDSVSKWENGESKPLFDRWLDLANELDIHPSMFWEISELILDKEKVKN